MFTDYGRTKLEISNRRKIIKIPNCLEMKQQTSKQPLLKEEITELENKNMKYHNHRDAAKTALRGRFRALNVFSGKEH